MSDIAHSPIGASSMYRWSECPGSIKKSEGVESPTSVYAEEGTIAHDIAANCLLGKPPPKGTDGEMLEAIQVYLDTINGDIQKETFHKKYMLVEHAFDLGEIHPGLFGTADCVYFNQWTGALYVYDYKHGKGIPVEAEGNQQGLYYALGALLTCGFKATAVEIIIVQPRCPHPKGPVRRWRRDVCDMIDFAAELKTAAVKTEDPNAPLKAGDHCRFCPVAATCSEQENQVFEMAKTVFDDVENYDPERLGLILTKIPQIKAWAKSVEEFAYQELNHGRQVPGFKMVEKRGTRKWRDKTKVEAAIDNLFKVNVNDLYEHSLKSVTQMEKQLGKGSKEILKDLVVSVSSGTTIAPESDPRKSIASVEEIFGVFN